MKSRGKHRLGCFVVIFGIVLMVLILLAAPARDMVYRTLYPCKYTELVEQACKERGVPQSLVYAVIKNESSFRPEAVSEVGARGLMQITEETFEWIKARMNGAETFDDLFDPETNIWYGTYLLSVLLEEFGTQRNALCAYHAGWGSVKNWLSDPDYAPDGNNIESIPFSDTNYYVDKVLKTVTVYQELYQID